MIHPYLLTLPSQLTGLTLARRTDVALELHAAPRAVTALDKVARAINAATPRLPAPDGADTAEHDERLLTFTLGQLLEGSAAGTVALGVGPDIDLTRIPAPDGVRTELLGAPIVAGAFARGCVALSLLPTERGTLPATAEAWAERFLSIS